MMKGKKPVAASLIAVLVTLSLVGCTTFSNFKEAFIDKESSSDDTIRIGVFEPLSGIDSPQGELELQGIKLAHQLYPEVLGKKVELIYADNRSDIDAADTAMADLMKRMPLVVLGSYGSIYSLKANAHLEAAKVPGIAITNTNPLVTRNHPYYFRVSFVESYQAVALARYNFEQLKQTKTAILIPKDDDQAAAMASTYKNKFTTLTDDEDAIIAYEQFEAGQESFITELQIVEKSGSNTVFISGDIPDAINIIKQAKKMGLGITFLGDSSWSTDEFKKGLGRYASQNVAFSTLFSEKETVTETAQQFLDAYAQKYGQGVTPDMATALGFDAYLLAVNAITAAGEKADGEMIKQALMNTISFQGASGEITLNSMGDPIKSVVINTYINRQASPVCTISAVEPKPEEKTKSTKKDKKKKDKKSKKTKKDKKKKKS